jgi:hypothetical protein
MYNMALRKIWMEGGGLTPDLYGVHYRIFVQFNSIQFIYLHVTCFLQKMVYTYIVSSSHVLLIAVMQSPHNNYCLLFSFLA